VALYSALSWTHL